MSPSRGGLYPMSDDHEGRQALSPASTGDDSERPAQLLSPEAFLRTASQLSFSLCQVLLSLPQVSVPKALPNKQ